jgi:myo-inositol-1(or 4)-monophosphatase
VVAVGSTRVIERPRIGDVDNALVMELMGPRTFYAERGKGARIYVDGQYRKPKLSKNTDLETVVWSMTVPARPAELIFPTAAKLIDLTSLKGGFYACNSTSYSLTRLLTNQLDACVDIANRYYRDIPKVVQDLFINAGRGAILGIAPYDIAASLLIAEEAGCVVTDAYGNSLQDVLLLDSATGNHQSMVAAANEELHEKLLSFFDTRIRQYEQLFQSRPGA